jgi:uncharacterized damage-inducible protein DinB
MTERSRWFSRTFTFDAPASAFASIVERLRGTPARLDERLRGSDRATVIARLDGAWSIQENAGHLLDLEPLWLGRLDDFESGAERLRAADLENRQTHDANHNAGALHDILVAFRREREALVARLERYDGAFIVRAALHPRLAQPMRVVDHAFFVAEHDDHHLATITALMRRAAGQAEDRAGPPPNER